MTLTSVSLPFVHGFAMVTATQSLAAVAGAVFAPAISAITLGLFGPKLFSKRVGRNEAFNHAGNAVSAALAGALAWKFGPVVVFWLMGALTVASVAAALRIRNGDIDNAVARGLDCEPDENCDQPGGWRVLVENRPLLLFAAIAFLFHLANAAMLTSVSQLLAKTVGKDSATSLTAACIVAAQLVMVPSPSSSAATSIAGAQAAVPRRVRRAGRARCAVYAVERRLVAGRGAGARRGGAGIFGALFPVVIADLTKGSGRFNVAQGAVATAQGLGAALSATLAGTIIVGAGYAVSFLTLAAIAAVGLALYAMAMPETKPKHPAPKAKGHAA